LLTLPQPTAIKDINDAKNRFFMLVVLINKKLKPIS
jgi:hypothetical protein